MVKVIHLGLPEELAGIQELKWMILTLGYTLTEFKLKSKMHAVVPHDDQVVVLYNVTYPKSIRDYVFKNRDVIVINSKKKKPTIEWLKAQMALIKKQEPSTGISVKISAVKIKKI